MKESTIEFLGKNPQLLQEIDREFRERTREGDASRSNANPADGGHSENQGTPHSMVDGTRLLRSIEEFARRFLILPTGVPLILALWTIATHVFELFECFPYLAVLSPAKRCGKTRLTEVVELAAANPFRTVNISEAALFRLVDDQRPTLILDEAETLQNKKSERSEAIRALLNAGNRQRSRVPRCVGNGHQLQFFEVFCPKLMCAIGNLPDTIQDRSIIVRMQRRRPEDKVERFLHRQVLTEAEELRGQIVAWVQQCRDDIADAYSKISVSFLEDRETELFEPLFALLWVMDISRVEELRKVAEMIVTQKAESDVDESLPLKLLVDIRGVFGDCKAMATSELIKALKEMEESPWGDIELTPRKLARMLRPFGVEARKVRFGEKTAQGYIRDNLQPAFERYL